MEWCAWQISNKKRYCIYPCISYSFNQRFQSQNKGHFRHSTSETHKIYGASVDGKLALIIILEYKASVPLGHGIAAMGIWFLTFQDHYIVSKCQNQTLSDTAPHPRRMCTSFTPMQIIKIMLQHNHIKSMARCKRLWQKHRVIKIRNFKHFCSST